MRWISVQIPEKALLVFDIDRPEDALVSDFLKRDYSA